MKRMLLTLGLIMLLTGCGQAKSGYSINFAPAGQSHKQELLEASQRVVERRLEALNQMAASGSSLQMQEQVKADGAQLQGSGGVIFIAVANPKLREALTKQLTAPFSFRIMVEAPRAQASIWSEQFGGFRETGITEKDLTWISTSTAPDGVKGTAVLSFTPAGQQHLLQLFAANQDKQVGIFVREHLVSRKLISASDTKGVIQIDNIPSAMLASIFADDVNVGALVTFQPLPDAEQK